MVLRVARGLLGVLVVVAIVHQLALVVELPGSPVFRFFCFFTTESNLFAAVVLLLGAVRPERSRRRDGLRGASVLFILITGIVYLIIVTTTNQTLGGASHWVNAVLHIVMPIALPLDWLAFPPSERIDRRRALRWLSVPIAYFFFSIGRGFFAEWYPYPFLDPGRAGGYSGVFITGAIMLLVMAGIAWLVAAAGDLRRRGGGTAGPATTLP
ncbi:MAG: Pr6Pr family membrane protein [Solirubrobacteraceae bacterium]|nr:Pr6Pr family membrane protein [Patulibacter sp.]